MTQPLIILQPGIPQIVPLVPPTPSQQGEPAQMVWPPQAAGVITATGGAGSGFAGDVNGPLASNHVDKLTGPGTGVVSLVAASLVWLATTLSPTISQAAPTSDVAPQNLTIQAQGPFTTAAVNKVPGNTIVQVPTPLAGTDFEGGFLVVDGSGAPLVRAGYYASGSSFGAIWFRDTGTPSDTNFGFLGNLTQTFLNNQTSVLLTIAGTSGNGITLSGTAAQQFLCGTSVTSAQWGTNNAAGVLNLAAGSAATQISISTGNITLTPINLLWGAAVVNPNIGMFANAAAGTTLSVTGQGAGGTNDGGPLAFAGGQHAGANTVDGSVKINTPLNCGELEFTPVNGANNLNNAQSDANVLDLLAGATAAFTVTLLRRIADTSLLFVRNNTSQTATIAYLTGGTVTLATATSALICSTGANLVKIIAGT